MKRREVSIIYQRFQKGVTYYDHSKAYETPIIFSAQDGATHLIDLDGNQIHQWNYIGLPGDLIDPRYTNGEKGHLLVQYEMLGNNSPVQYEMVQENKAGIFGNKSIAEIDWEGNVIWKWGDKSPTGGARQNHDWQKLPNGNTLLLVCVPRVIDTLSPKEIGDQGLYEVDSNGNIVWQWLAGDHLDQLGISQEGLQYLRNLINENEQDSWGYLELNTAQLVGENQWFDNGNSVFAPENIIISSRKASFVAIIEKHTGNIVWRIGPFSYRDTFKSPELRITNRQVPRPLDQTSGQHKPHIIPKGLPGEGNLLLLDNQGGSGYPPIAFESHAGSRVLEINPITKEIVWDYTAEDSGDPVWSFYTSFVGSTQRLPNGNTLINEGMNGRIFQITKQGEIVWEYQNPYIGTFTCGKNLVEDPMIYRAQAVPWDWLPV